MMQMLWRKAWWGEGNLWGYFTLTLVREVFTERVMLEQRFDSGKTCWIWKMKMWHKGNRTGKDPEMRVCLGCVQAVRRRSEWYESEWMVVVMRFQRVPGWPEVGEGRGGLWREARQEDMSHGVRFKAEVGCPRGSRIWLSWGAEEGSEIHAGRRQKWQATPKGKAWSWGSGAGPRPRDLWN